MHTVHDEPVGAKQGPDPGRVAALTAVRGWRTEPWWSNSERSDPREGQQGTVYLLHFDRPFTVNGVVLVQHYLGWTQNLAQRLRAHCGGRGSFVTRKAHAQGVGFTVVRTWQGTLDTERELRALGPKHLCPECGWPRTPDWPRRG